MLLVDPHAISNKAYLAPIDATLRLIALSLLQDATSAVRGDETAAQAQANYQYLLGWMKDALAGRIALSSSYAGDEATVKEGGTEGKVTPSHGESIKELWPVEEVVACLTYVRERVSVPRDMSVHAARRFRAHINLLLDALR